MRGVSSQRLVTAYSNSIQGQTSRRSVSPQVYLRPLDSTARSISPYPVEALSNRGAVMRRSLRGITPRNASGGRAPPTSQADLEPSLPPFFYEADPTDTVDVALLQELVALNLEVSARLNIKRLRPGVYDVEGGRVNLYFGANSELYVRAPGAKDRSPRKDAAESDAGSDMPLAAFLRELANVSMEVQELNEAAKATDALTAAYKFASSTSLLR